MLGLPVCRAAAATVEHGAVHPETAELPIIGERRSLDRARQALRGACLATGLAVSGTANVIAAPFVPTDDAVVLETGLPSADPRMREMRALGAELIKQPDNLPLAMRLAGRQLAMGVAEADPRFVGYAQATLARWWLQPTPAPLLVLRARIRQAQHEFDGAADDLRAALREDPGNLQALLVLASVDEVSGRLDEAGKSCTDLAKRRPGLIATACLASVQSLTGEAAAGYAALSDIVRRAPASDRSQQAWALVILGEIAIRLGDLAAESDLRQALALDDRDIYALTVYADYLLDHNRAPEVVKLLTGFERVDALYLRRVLAMQASNDPEFPAARAALAARFEAARRQGDRVHLRDASRFAREIARDGPAALELAKQNWTSHKAPVDVRLLLEAALACHNPAAAWPAADWVATSHLEDVTLRPLLAQLGY